MNASPTIRLAEHVSQLRFEDLPPRVVTVAKQCLLDIVGTSIAGSHEPAPEAVFRMLTDFGSAVGTSPVVGRTGHLSALDAALVNGTSAHALDFDDVSGVMLGHPSAPVFPAVLALAHQKRSTGRELITAFVAGFETEVRVAAAMGADHYARGFHTTGTVGTIGAAAAAARLLGLGAKETEVALGLAATQAAGLKSMFGTDAKPLHAGKAAQSGLIAALLAENGFTSASGALEMEQGFMSTHSNGGDTDQLIASFGDPWYIEHCLFKYHAACYLTHASIEASLQLRRQTPDFSALRRVEVHVPVGHLAACAISNPRTGLEAKFSLAYVTALALVTGSATTQQFTDKAVQASAKVRTLLPRIVVIPEPGMATFMSRVETFGAAGHSAETVDVSEVAWVGNPAEQWPTLENKFLSLVTPACGHDVATRLLAEIRSIENHNNVAPLAALFTSERPAERQIDAS